MSSPPRSGNGWSSKVRPGPPGSWCRALCCTKTVKHSRAVGVNRAASAGRSVVLVARAVSAGTRPNEMNHVHRFVRGAKRAEKLTLVAWARHAWALVGSATPSRCRKSRWSAQMPICSAATGRKTSNTELSPGACDASDSGCLHTSLLSASAISSSVAVHVLVCCLACSHSPRTVVRDVAPVLELVGPARAWPEKACRVAVRVFLMFLERRG